MKYVFDNILEYESCYMQDIFVNEMRKIKLSLQHSYRANFRWTISAHGMRISFNKRDVFLAVTIYFDVLALATYYRVNQSLIPITTDIVTYNSQDELIKNTIQKVYSHFNLQEYE